MTDMGHAYIEKKKVKKINNTAAWRAEWIILRLMHFQLKNKKVPNMISRL